MWIDTRGAKPVTAFTWAASAIFSHGSRGLPGVENTLNRVPELPYAHEGTSIVNVSRSCNAVLTVISAVLAGVVDGVRGDSQRKFGGIRCGPTCRPSVLGILASVPVNQVP